MKATNSNYTKPVQDFISLKLNQQKNNISKVSIFDYSGKELISINNSFQRIDISSFSSGIYFLQINTTNNLILNRKIIKEPVVHLNNTNF
ncbi:T9SS type A sorting domain-containing protein [Polaribacter sp.]|uniref:T9SS type A sorting domain-containing protein n=1 Tax=Polaribacter sp. TaxID=1920175 RepID=UPI003FA74B00